MRAVILAAGAGRRLQPIVGAWPKCLAPVGDRTLLEWQLRHLHDQAVTPITLVLGYRKDAVEAVCGREVEIVYNPDYASTNSLYSLWLARNLLSDGFVVLNSDVLFHPHLLTRLLASPHEDALLMAPREAGVCYSDEEMKVHVRNGRVAAIDKALPERESDGENLGIAKFGPAGAKALLAEADTLIGAGAVREWLPRAFHAFSQKRPLHVVETDGLPWIEIDFPADYERACREVLPAIDAVDTALAHAARTPHDPATTPFRRIYDRV